MMIGRRKTVFCVVGTRPEAIKMAPVIAALRKEPRLRAVLCSTSQHGDMLREALAVFGIRPDFDLHVMRRGQDPLDVARLILERIAPVLRETCPDMVLVQGDTTTAFAAALAAFYSGIAVGHVEAGLRTYRMDSPYPEEINRQLISRIASVHFAPTRLAVNNLVSEGIPRSAIHLSGNTVIDVVRMVLAGEFPGGALPPGLAALALEPGKKLVLATAHRRESFGRGIKDICLALKELARREDVRVVFSVHPNPVVRKGVVRTIGKCRNVILLRPPAYFSFVRLIRASHLIITDSGGIQEEAAYLGKPVLVAREVTERMEGVSCGAAMLVGTDRHAIVRAATKLLNDSKAYARMAVPRKIYGNGRASAMIADILAKKP